MEDIFKKTTYYACKLEYIFGEYHVSVIELLEREFEEDIGILKQMLADSHWTGEYTIEDQECNPWLFYSNGYGIRINSVKRISEEEYLVLKKYI